MNASPLRTCCIKTCDHCGARCLTYLARWTGKAQQVWRRCTCCGGNSFESNHRWLPHTVLEPFAVTFEDLPVENTDSPINRWVQFTQVRTSEHEK